MIGRPMGERQGVRFWKVIEKTVKIMPYKLGMASGGMK